MAMMCGNTREWASLGKRRGSQLPARGAGAIEGMAATGVPPSVALPSGDKLVAAGVAGRSDRGAKPRWFGAPARRFWHPPG